MSDQPLADPLVRAAARAVRSGNPSAARAVLLAVTRDFPDDVRGWMGLAHVAQSDDERIEALERIVALAPENERARAALASLQASKPTLPVDEELDAPVVPPLVEPPYQTAVAPPIEHDVEPRTASGTGWLWPIIAIALLLLVGVACLALLMPSVFRSAGTPSVVAPSAETAAGVLPSAAATSVSTTDGTGVALAPSATIDLAAGRATTEATGAATGQTPVAETSAAQQSTALPTLLPTSGLTATSPLGVATPTVGLAQTSTSTALALGALLELDNWRMTLANQDRLLLLDGPVGNLQPKGRFVLAVVSLANMSGQSRGLPADLFVLTDVRGMAYHPTPALSTSYLAAYGRGLRGDLSLEDQIPPGGGYYSVPVIFDVPTGAQSLRFSVGDGSVGGWDVTP